jgi:hypothetical protein
MVRSSSRVLFALALSCLAAASLTGCPKDEFDPDTWVDKLDDPKQVETAIQKLEQLRDPSAIKPLGAIWKKHNKWSRALRAIIVIARDPDAKISKGPAWADAVPFLEEAVKDYDPSDKRSVEDAVVACDALGEAKNPDSVAVLIEAANGPSAKTLPKLSAGQNVRIAALKALGAYGGNERAVDTLVSVLQVIDPKTQLIQLNAAAANALAASESPKALQPLLRALFEASPIYHQVRAAVTRIGKPAIPELVKIFEGKHAAINKFASEAGFASECEKEEGPDTRCQAPGNLQFKAASLLGDLRAREATAVLTAALGRPGRVAFYDMATGNKGPSSHTAVLDALRKIGDPSSAAAVLAVAKDTTNDPTLRSIAVDVYSMLATDSVDMTWLAGMMKEVLTEAAAKDEAQAAAMAYARLVRSQGDLKPIQYLIDRYAGQASAAEAKVAKATDAKAKKTLEGAVADYRDMALLYEQYKARAMVGVKCKLDPACLVGYLDKSADAVVTELGIKLDPKAKKSVKEAFRTAALERALIDVGKLGPKAEAGMPALLKNVEVTDRIIRDGVLLALPKVAKQPCDACATRLNEIIEAQKGQTTLDYLTADTRIVLNYFLANKAKILPAAGAAAPKK